MYYFKWQKGIQVADRIEVVHKHLKMRRLSWIIHVGPMQSQVQCNLKRKEAKEDVGVIPEAEALHPRL